MTNKQDRKISGFRFVVALAGAELELRKQEGAPYGFRYLNNQVLMRPLIDAGFCQGQAMKNYAQLMDFALCFILRYSHANRLYAMAQQPLGVSDSAIKRHKYIQNKCWARMDAERQEDDDYESEEETAAWVEEQRKLAGEEGRKQRLKEAQEAQKKAAEERSQVQRFMRDNPQVQGEYKDVWDVLVELSQGTLRWVDAALLDSEVTSCEK